MKKIRLLLCAALICVLAFMLLTACDAGLDSPGVIRFDADTQTISWEKVTGAFGYSVKIGEKE